MRTYYLVSLMIASLSAVSTTAVAQQTVVWPSYSWMLPKTVIDLAVAFSFDECKPYKLKDSDEKVPVFPVYSFKISPTLTSRAVADLGIGIKSLHTDDDLPKDWADSSVVIGANGGTHILNSVSAHSTDETATIIGNVVTGIVKLAGVFVGAEADKAVALLAKKSLDKDLLAGKSLDQAVLAERFSETEESCSPTDDPAFQVHKDRDEVYALQRALVDGSSQDTAQTVMAKIHALQNLMTKEQSDLTSSEKATIDPGYISPKDTQIKPDSSPPAPREKPGPIEGSGGLALVGYVWPRLEELQKILPKNLDKDSVQKILDSLKINVYLDFAHAQPPVCPARLNQKGECPKKFNEDGEYPQREFEPHATALTYREPVYIPVLVWRGEPTEKPTKFRHQVLPTQIIAFAQYGLLRWIPFDAAPFGDNSFTVHFADNGEVIDGEVTSKSRVQNMTGLFSSAASGAYTIGNAVRTADSPTTHAAETQGKADEIYQNGRLALCQAEPGSCPSK